jgi:glutathione S-transferase
VKFYNSMGPNPQVVRMFMAEKDIDIPREEIDLRTGENRQEPYLSRNPSGTSPCLELDDGSYLSEITTICEYLEEKFPNPLLIGSTPEARAKTRMWVRRIDLGIVEPMANGFRYGEGLAMFKDRIHCIPQAADDLKQIAQEKIAWLDGQMGGNEFVLGERFTLADILLYVFLSFGEQIGQPLNRENKWVSAWFDRVASRPSAKA